MKKLLLLCLFVPFISNGQIITTIAGNGSTIHSGDGGPATLPVFMDRMEWLLILLEIFTYLSIIAM